MMPVSETEPEWMMVWDWGGARGVGWERGVDWTMGEGVVVKFF